MGKKSGNCQKKEPKGVGVHLHSFSHIPGQSVTVEEIIDDPEGNKRILSDPAVFEDKTEKNDAEEAENKTLTNREWFQQDYFFNGLASLA